MRQWALLASWLAPAEALLPLLGGRLGPAHTPDTLTITSDVVTLDRLRRNFSGI
jgi:hypothetical protein